MYNRISVFSPASIANLCSGFDVCGMAIEGLGDELTICRNDKSFAFECIGDYGHEVPHNPETNATTVPILLYCAQNQIEPRFKVTLNKRMPIGSGLGSSGSSAAAGIYALNELLELNKSKYELLPFALEGERIACGAAHADNVAASLLGNVIVVASYDPLKVLQLPISNNQLALMVIHPQIILKTADSRKVLSNEITLKTAVAQLGAFGSLVCGFLTGSNSDLRVGLNDFIAEGARANLIPGFKEAKEIAINESGCIGFGIAGSGPSMFALCESNSSAESLAKNLEKIFDKLAIKVNKLITQIDQKGCRVIDRN
jgi:homoserine kinase